MPTGVERYDINAVIEPQIIAQVIEGIVSKSAALTMFTQLPNMTSDKTKMRVLSGLPTAYWVDESANNGRKNITKQMWNNKYIVAEELAVIVPIKENLLNDADIDLWASIQPRIVEAFAKKIDEAVFTGVDKPAGFRADILTSITQCGAVVTQGDTLYSAINDAMAKVEESGFLPSGIIGGIDVKAKFRMMLDTNGQPIKGTEIDAMPKAYIDNGSWDKTKAQLIVGDMSNAVYAIRQDMTFKLLEEAIIQDPSTGDILYNLAQEDMVALRCVMRLGWEIPNPINSLNPDESVRFPFAAINPAVAPTKSTVTVTVKDNASTPVAVSEATVVLGGMTAVTNASGAATFKTEKSSYNYLVAKEGYATVSGKAKVTGTTLAVAATLIAD